MAYPAANEHANQQGLCEIQADPARAQCPTGKSWQPENGRKGAAKGRKGYAKERLGSSKGRKRSNFGIQPIPQKCYGDACCGQRHRHLSLRGQGPRKRISVTFGFAAAFEPRQLDQN